MKNVKIILENLPRNSREQIYLEAAALSSNGNNLDWEKFFPCCQDILVRRLKTIKGVGQGAALEILTAVGDFLEESVGG